uniref:Uncharacterized protein n=1 Tax=Vespula pensylvanica TaxID=30213 RepID=A0A834P199_VESPE|nr:hypothetical protein H0235_009136 [Vespula pensylvanica]
MGKAVGKTEKERSVLSIRLSVDASQFLDRELASSGNISHEGLLLRIIVELSRVYFQRTRPVWQIASLSP